MRNRTGLPAQCAVVIELTADGGMRLDRVDRRPTAEVNPTGVGTAFAAEVANALAYVHGADAISPDDALPTRCELETLLEVRVASVGNGSTWPLLAGRSRLLASASAPDATAVGQPKRR